MPNLISLPRAFPKSKVNGPQIHVQGHVCSGMGFSRGGPEINGVINS
jgi:hypothetical protein